MLEEELKTLIKEKYGSVRQFALKIDIPYTTVDTILKRGIDNSNVGNVLKMCKALGISIDSLADGKEIISNFEFSNTNQIDNFIKENTISDEELERRLKELNEKEGVKIIFDKDGELTEEELNQIVSHAMFVKEQHYKNKNS